MRKRLIHNEPSWLFDCHRTSTLKQRLRSQIDWRQKKDALFSLIHFFGSFCIYYIPHNYGISFRKTCHMPFRKLIPPSTLTGPVSENSPARLESSGVSRGEAWGDRPHPLIVGPNWGPKGWKNLWDRVPAPRLSQGLDPPLGKNALKSLNMPSLKVNRW